MRVLLLVSATLCYACGNFPQANDSNVGVAASHHGALRLQRIAKRAYVVHNKKSFIKVCATLCAPPTLHTASGIAVETSALSLSKRLVAFHADILVSRRNLEALITKMDDRGDILRFNAKFQKIGSALKKELGYTTEGGSLQLGVDLNKIPDPKLAKSILKQLQEINTMLSVPLRSVEKVLDN